MFKFSRKKGLVFILFEDTKFGFRAFEARHSMMIAAQSRDQLVNEIKREVKKEFNGKFYGKIVLREFNDLEITL